MKESVVFAVGILLGATLALSASRVFPAHVEIIGLTGIPKEGKMVTFQCLMEPGVIVPVDEYLERFVDE